MLINSSYIAWVNNYDRMFVCNVRLISRPLESCSTCHLKVDAVKHGQLKQVTNLDACI